MKIEPILRLLAVMTAFFTLALFLAEFFFRDDSQLFQVLAGILTGTVGAFLARIKPNDSKNTASAATTVNLNTTENP